MNGKDDIFIEMLKVKSWFEFQSWPSASSNPFDPETDDEGYPHSTSRSHDRHGHALILVRLTVDGELSGEHLDAVGATRDFSQLCNYNMLDPCPQPHNLASTSGPRKVEHCFRKAQIVRGDGTKSAGCLL